MDLLEAVPVFVCFSELGGSTFRGTSISSSRESIHALLHVHYREVVPISESI